MGNGVTCEGAEILAANVELWGRGVEYACKAVEVQHFPNILQQKKQKAIACTGHIKEPGMCSITFHFYPVASSMEP
jgi:hypothetical protein